MTQESSSPLAPIRDLQAALGCSRSHAIKLVDDAVVRGKRVGTRVYVFRDALADLIEN